ncbi:hypothetical protein FG386_001681 [Cryptosporidium ryanae]|uniref:uncharacterized protein n=1 Tax=Cryptosporidium ryanae TaxID=515981 RepID=UPI003519F8CD|nr:hypothetical protein FG386_001681 [Cryptosporidium ryanae]
MNNLLGNSEQEVKIKTIPIKYLGGKYSENLILIEFQGKLNISKIDTETGELVPSESPEDYDNVSIGKLSNYHEIGGNFKNLNDEEFIEKLVEHSKHNPIEFEIGYYTLSGKVS